MHVLLLLANSHAFRLRTHYFNRLLGVRLVFAWFFGVSTTSTPLYSHGSSILPHFSALGTLWTLPCPIRLRRSGRANRPFSLPRAGHAFHCAHMRSFPG